MEFPYKKRIARVRSELNQFGPSSYMLLSSAARVSSSRDLFYPYRQSSDFFYLCGTFAPNMLLLISPKHKKPILITEKADAARVLWEGKDENPRRAADRIGAELRVVRNVKSEVLAALRSADCLFYQNESNTLAWHIANHLIALPSHERGTYPKAFIHSDLLLEKIRLIKDKQEVDAIRKAAAVSYEALVSCLDTIQVGVSEAQIMSSVEYVMRLNGCTPAFATIVACGPSAAVLHHSSGTRRLRANQLLLVDWGAAYNLYCADISRCFPVGGKFSKLHGELYQIVLSAQKKALKKLRSGVKIKAVYDVAAREITDGLCDMGVLRGKAARQFEDKAFKRYFPHGIGHSVGLDAHDIGNLRGNNDATLEEGMVFTVEPGIYFQKRTGHIPACGIRIEDTVLVTKSGCENLTEAFPKELHEIEELMEDVQALEFG